jgi:glycine/D-amino acid oxidase-like deaminating enzyme
LLEEDRDLRRFDVGAAPPVQALAQLDPPGVAVGGELAREDRFGVAGAEVEVAQRRADLVADDGVVAKVDRGGVARQVGQRPAGDGEGEERGCGEKEAQSISSVMGETPSKRYEVVVIGAGITGLSAALHLKERGVGRVALSSSTSRRGATRLAAGLGTAGFIDNFTRFSHPFGAPAAAELWRFSGEALKAFLAGAKRLGVPVATGRHYRLVAADDELVEARKAVAELTAEGFHPVLRLGEKAIAGLALGERVLAVQEELEAIAFERATFMNALDARVQADRVPAASKLTRRRDGIEVTLADGQTIMSEMVVCAAHLEIGTLVPEIASALVSVADQWCRVEGAAFPPALAGSVFSAKHGHEWGGFLPDGALVLGGARYLRKWAGIEATEATTEPKISEHLLSLAMRTFKLTGAPKLVGAHGFLDCRPCDELPIIGPLFGEGRILVATGFLGAGLTLGWLAGDCLAELIASGKSARLPRRLWPERLRSLES